MKHLPPIRYSIAPLSPEAHLFEVRCSVADPDPQGQQFALPAWIPGSYRVRDFARLRASPRDTCVLSLKSTRVGAPLRRRPGA